VALLGLGYLGALRAVQRDPQGWGLPRLLGISALVGFPLLLMLPPTSADYLSYMFTGRVIFLHHLNPWQHTLGEFPGEFSYLPVEVWSSDLKCIYGPVWAALMAGMTAVSQLVRPGEITPASFCLSVLLLRLGNLIALGAGAVALWRINGFLWPSQQRLVTAAYLLNPLLLFESIGALHNDIWGVAFLLWACHLFLRSDFRYVGLLALSILTKPVAVAMIPLLAVYHWRQGDRRSLVCLALAALGTLAALQFTAAEYLTSRVGGSTSLFQYSATSLPQGIAASLALLRPGVEFVTTAQAVTPVLAALFTCAYLGFLWRTRTREQVILYTTWAVALYLSTAYIQTMPWYFVWPLALFGMTRWTLVSANVALASSGLLLSYGMYFWNHNGGDPPSLVVSFLLSMAGPIGLSLAGRCGWWTVSERSVIKQSERSAPGQPPKKEARQQAIDPVYSRTARSKPRSA
jgi:hypothetical protein